ncbi:hypothetical protein OG613_45985 (plasmid) [Streptomyces sp. NBC_00015]|uniref:hypothetical protein n=1 Tax=Streptomyces sp. NBC_00015 TaxID=2903611 RepID=UPI0032458052
MATPYPYTSLRAGSGRSSTHFLQHDGSPPERVGIVLIMPGRVDPVALSHADKHREVVHRNRRAA